MKLEQLHLNDFEKTEITPKLSIESFTDLEENSIKSSVIDFTNSNVVVTLEPDTDITPYIKDNTTIYLKTGNYLIEPKEFNVGNFALIGTHNSQITVSEAKDKTRGYLFKIDSKSGILIKNITFCEEGKTIIFFYANKLKYAMFEGCTFLKGQSAFWFYNCNNVFPEVETTSGFALQSPMITISNCNTLETDYPVLLNERCEYTSVDCCQFLTSKRAVQIFGGNNRITNCNIEDAEVSAIYIKNLINSGHGLISGCTINHNKGAVIIETKHGELIDNCCFFYTPIIIQTIASDVGANETTGVQFNACMINSSSKITDTSTGYNVFSNCMFSSYTPSVSNKNCKFINCFNYGTGEIIDNTKEPVKDLLLNTWYFNETLIYEKGYNGAFTFKFNSDGVNFSSMNYAKSTDTKNIIEYDTTLVYDGDKWLKDEYRLIDITNIEDLRFKDSFTGYMKKNAILYKDYKPILYKNDIFIGVNNGVETAYAIAFSIFGKDLTNITKDNFLELPFNKTPCTGGITYNDKQWPVFAIELNDKTLRVYFYNGSYGGGSAPISNKNDIKEFSIKTHKIIR